MKKVIQTVLTLCTFIAVFSILSTCKNETPEKLLAVKSETEITVEKPYITTPEFNNYWYKGEAEISSYELEQARYGEIRKGKAVLIYVTEDFLPNKQVKADGQSSKNSSVLKLNATKKFNTGVYPYSIMQSTFYPVSNNQHAIKVSISMQEWCGHVYTQLNNREQFEVNSHSYFENDADKEFSLDKAILENELWTKLRINPKSLPTGELQIIPSFEYLKLHHKSLKTYKAKATLTVNKYTISYPELNRTLNIHFNDEFPFDILSWEESFKSGFGSKAKILTTKATKLKTIKSPYWNKKYNKDEVLRETLQLN
ncbi:MAG: septum formation inhibitor Maf [Algibacter sp.]